MAASVPFDWTSNSGCEVQVLLLHDFLDVLAFEVRHHLFILLYFLIHLYNYSLDTLLASNSVEELEAAPESFTTVLVLLKDTNELISFNSAIFIIIGFLNHYLNLILSEVEVLEHWDQLSFHFGGCEISCVRRVQELERRGQLRVVVIPEEFTKSLFE